MLMIAENDTLHRQFAVTVVSELWNPASIEILEADNGRTALEMVSEGGIKRAILDLQLPEFNGIQIAQALWDKTPDAQIVFWSNYADEAYVRNLARVVPGSARYGYVLKSAAQPAMRTTLESVFFKDRKAIDQEVRHVQKRLNNRHAGLSDTEYEGLIDIALGLTDQIIANRRNLTVRGVQNRLRRVYEKLDVISPQESPGNAARYNSRTRAITCALERGLINFDVLMMEQHKLDEWLCHTN